MTDTITHPPFTGIYNFRDVGRVVNSLGGSNLVLEKSIYRSGRLDGASPSDRKKLASEYGLETVIDLRTKSEHIKQAETYSSNNENRAATDVSLRPGSALPDKGPWDTIYINFVSKKFEMDMLKQLKWW